MGEPDAVSPFARGLGMSSLALRLGR